MEEILKEIETDLYSLGEGFEGLLSQMEKQNKNLNDLAEGLAEFMKATTELLKEMVYQIKEIKARVESLEAETHANNVDLKELK